MVKHLLNSSSDLGCHQTYPEPELHEHSTMQCRTSTKCKISFFSSKPNYSKAVCIHGSLFNSLL